MASTWLPVNKVMRFVSREEAAEVLDTMPSGCAVQSGKTIVVCRAMNMTFTLASAKPEKLPEPPRAPARCVDDLLPADGRRPALPRNTRHLD